MARQLYAQGKSVDSLILISPSQLTRTSRLERVCKFVDHIGKFLHLSPKKRLHTFLRINHLGSYLLYSNYRKTIEFEELQATIRTRWAKWEQRGGAWLSELQLLFPPIQSLYTYPLTFAWAVTNYAPSDRYPGKTTFIWHRDEPFDSTAWQQVVEATTAEEYFLPGTHETLLTDHLSTVAEQVQLCLDQTNDLQREGGRGNDSSKKEASTPDRILANAGRETAPLL